MRRKRAHKALLFILVLLGATKADATDIDITDCPHFTAVITDSFSPYEAVRYELKVRGSTFIVVLTKELAGGFGELQGLALVSEEVYRDAVRVIESCLLEERSTAVQTTAVQTTEDGFDLRILVRHDGSERQYVGQLASLEPSDPVWCAASQLMQTYRAVGDPVEFRNQFFDPGEYGELMVDSTPPARIYIDGVDSGFETPARQIRLLVGVHEIRFVNHSLGIDRTYDVTIEADLTTRLNIELR